MADKPLVAAFAFDIEALYLPLDSSTYKVMYLVVKGTSEEQWIRSFIPESRIILYEMTTTNADYKAPQDIEDLLTESNVSDKVLENGITYVIANDEYSEKIEEWSKKNNIVLISSPQEMKKNLEDKIFFDKWLAKNALPKPKKLVSLEAAGPGEKVVLQKARSGGMDGTYIGTVEEMQTLVEKKHLDTRELLIRNYVEGTSCGITLFILPTIIAVSQMRRQCFQYIKDKPVFLGIQWMKTDALISETFTHLATILQGEGFVGYANIDFIITDKDEIYILECNPRFSVATTQLISHPETISHLHTLHLFVTWFVSKKNNSTDNKVYPFLQSSFQGSTMYTAIQNGTPENPIKITHTNPNSNPHEALVYYSGYESGESITEEGVSTGILYSAEPLFDNNGAINQTGLNMLNIYQ